MSDSIRLLLADDHPLILQALVALLEREADLQVLACCANGRDVLEEARRRQPDMVILDIRMPGMGGLEVARGIREERLPIRIVLYTAGITPEEMIEATRLGIDGIMLKATAAARLIQCLRKVQAGGQWIERQATMQALEKLVDREHKGQDDGAQLSPRELELVKMVALGMRNREIASRLFISEGTVKVHLYNIYRKLDMTGGRLALLRYAHDRGLA